VSDESVRHGRSRERVREKEQVSEQFDTEEEERHRAA